MSAFADKFSAGNFSDVDRAGDPSQYIAYLDRARSPLEELRRFGNALLGLKRGDRLLDVGCGTGDALHELAAIVGPQGCVIGLDFSEAMLGEAGKRAATAGVDLSFVRGDAHRLAFPDGYFDSCFAERLFIHLDDPLRAVREMTRVLKPGGRVVVIETDLEMVALDSADNATSRTVWNLFMSGVRNGYIGRQLFGLFQKAGLKNTVVHAKPLVLHDLDVLNRLLPFEATARAATEQHKINPEAVTALLADLRERNAAGRFFGLIPAFIAVGQRP
jgi:SAM-dependent methyltransferase